MGALDDMISKLAGMPVEEVLRLTEAAKVEQSGCKWRPNPGPQTQAYLSEADVLLYGGEPGGGKSQLALGLAFNEHKRALIMRRQYGDLDRLVEDALKIHGSKAGFNGSPPPKLKISEDHIIDFAAAHRVGDEQSQMGKGRDLIVFDEATHFAESQVRFVMGWLRTDTPGQRCRVVMATNPPLNPEGLWVIKMFAPWLDPVYHNPAKYGELRWVISDLDGNDQWVDGPGEYPVTVAGREKMVRATSRTYIPAAVSDNPYYAATDYERQLDAMPEPWRSLLMGGFKTSFQDAPNQVIPTRWITEAQARWTEKPPVGVPQCAIGVDATGGGRDPMVLAIRHDGWFDRPVEIPAKDIPNERAGRMGGGIIVAHRRNSSEVIIDMGGGYGTSMYEHLKANDIPVKGYVGSSKSTRRTKDGLLGFFNHRSASIWKLRDALDPDQQDGSVVALPPDAELAADLASWTLDMEYNGIKVTSKEEINEKLGRSTNKGDAVVMAWSEGPTYLTDGPSWRASFFAPSEEQGINRTSHMPNKAIMRNSRGTR